MPRSWPEKSGSRREPSERSERSGPPQRKAPSGLIDEQVLSVRETGASYSAIARSLELRRAVDAHRAFVRAVARREDGARDQLVSRECARLDQLELRIRERDAANPEKMERRLQAVTVLREALP